MNLLDLIRQDEVSRVRKIPVSEWMQPVSVTLAQDPFSDPDWIYEQLDGERCLTFRNDNDLTLMSRNRKYLNDKYPHLVEALRLQPCRNFIIDGNVVAPAAGDIRSRDHRGQQMRSSQEGGYIPAAPARYHIFDLLFADGYDISGLHSGERRCILKKMFNFTGPLLFAELGSITSDADGGRAIPGVHRNPGEPSSLKSARRQNFIIGGYTEPRGNRIGFGALLVGYYKEGRLCYAGKVGSGYDNEMLRSISRQLIRDERKTSPFTSADVPSQDVHWVTPKYVGDVEFSEWTKDGRLRHPSFKGLSRGKPLSSISREES